MTHRLETGWDPETPSEDTIQRRATLNMAAFWTAVADAAGGEVHRDDDVVICHLGRAGWLFNGGLLTRPIRSSEDADRVVETVRGFYGEAPDFPGPAFVFSPWPTPDLSLYGWKLEGHPPLMVRPAGGALPSDPPGVRVERVSDAGALLRADETLRGAYPAEGVSDQLLGPGLLSHPGFGAWVAVDTDGPAAVGIGYASHGVNGVHSIATYPRKRGRGIGAAATWRPALADAALPSVLLASDEGRPVYERMGYLPIERWTLWAVTR